jgi:threonine dehydrogenase-like Zn-dependent dehydrogenase
MGRCPVRSIFPEALDMLQKKQHLLDFMAGKIMPMSQAVEGYELFNSMKVQKVVFEAQK